MKVGSLFAGIGGFDLGFERAGMEIAWSCDIEPFAQHILKKHWPDAPVYGDITQLKGAEVEPVDVLCGGFPCQDISSAGKGAGIKEGTRSGLWSEYARLVGELRPRWVVIENVAALRRRGLDRVLGDLSLLGYDAEWDRIRASDVGAPHQRARLWIVAYPRGEGRRQDARSAPRDEAAHGRQPTGDHVAGGARSGRLPDRQGTCDVGGSVPHPNGTGSQGRPVSVGPSPEVSGLGHCRSLPYAEREQLRVEPGRRAQPPRPGSTQPAVDGEAQHLADAPCVGQREPADEAHALAGGRDTRRIFGGGSQFEAAAGRFAAGQWLVEPDVGRVAHGVPARVDRLRSLGNALVPQIAEWIGTRILAYEESIQGAG